MPAVAATGEHEATAAGPVVIGAGHDVVVQPLPLVAADPVHEATGTLVVLLVEQLVVVYELPAPAAALVHEATGTLFATTAGGQVVVVQLLPPLAALPAHEATGTLVVLFVPHTVATYELPAFAVCGEQLETPTVGEIVGGGQVVVVQELAPVAADGVHDTTATLVVLLLLQLVVV